MRFEPLRKWFQIVTLSTERVQSRLICHVLLTNTDYVIQLNALAWQKGEFCEHKCDDTWSVVSDLLNMVRVFNMLVDVLNIIYWHVYKNVRT